MRDWLDWFIIAVVFAIIIGVLFGPLIARAEDHAAMHSAEHMQQHAKYHADFYSKWEQANGGSCCNDADCAPIDDKDFHLKGDVLEVRINGNWISVPKEKIRPYAAPDAQSHLCHLNEEVYCFVFGGAM
jgi:hypothetical protein